MSNTLDQDKIEVAFAVINTMTTAIDNAVQRINEEVQVLNNVYADIYEIFKSQQNTTEDTTKND